MTAISLSQLSYAADTDIRIDYPEINGLPIDKCVAGKGWGDPTDLFNPLNRERCSEISQHHIATVFCQQQGFGAVSDSEDAWAISLNWPEKHAIWMHSRDGGPFEGEWGSLTGGHHFSHIICTKEEETEH